MKSIFTGKGFLQVDNFRFEVVEYVHIACRRSKWEDASLLLNQADGLRVDRIKGRVAGRGQTLRSMLAQLGHRMIALMYGTHSGLFASSPGVTACSGPTTENDELSEAGARVLVVSVTESFRPGAYIKMNSLTFEKSLCFGMCDSIDCSPVLALEGHAWRCNRRGPYGMLMIPVFVQV